MPNMSAPVAEPEIAEPTIIGEDEKSSGNLFNVVLLNDDDHSYEYVIEMLMGLFVKSKSQAFRHAREVDATGRTIVLTCGKDEAIYGKDQIQGYGADPLIPASKGSMSAVVEPA